jgi:hypothetical protein
MVLLLHQDLANLFGHRIFAQRLALADAIAIITNGFIFIIEIESQHLLCIFRCAHRLGSHRRHFAQVIDLTRQG